ncbi:hypothetical protein IM25_21410 [Rhodococcus sp. p52]|uniref:hypothetical protein n=1 Tax=Rhodococcus sp. p52 TaxID=935199 RepID=UPI00051A1583|nr:hypothetical protein [Rhodococcus sp. p52]AOD23822.1 hypothetical protein IM25_21410 [Rhodococcus sp. p52]
MKDPIVLEARIEQAACAERLQAQGVDPYLTEDFRDGIERAARIAVGMLTPRTITTHKELAVLPDGTVIIGPDGLVGEKRDWPLDLAVRYVNGTQEANADIPLPATVLYVPEARR